MKTDPNRVVARFEGKTAGREGKMVASDRSWRLTWDDGSFTLEELPMKGKRKLKVAELTNPFYYTRFDAWMPVNILNFYGKVSPGDSFDAVKAKILDTMTSERVLADVKKHAKPGFDPSDYVKGLRWSEREEHFLKVVPEDVEPFTAEGQDFSVSVKWTSFSAYSPDSDLGTSGDPYYSMIESTAPASARKLYQMLKAQPEALRSIPWSKFDDWLKANKINYKYQHSVWS